MVRRTSGGPTSPMKNLWSACAQVDGTFSICSVAIVFAELLGVGVINMDCGASNSKDGTLISLLDSNMLDDGL